MCLVAILERQDMKMMSRLGYGFKSELDHTPHALFIEMDELEGEEWEERARWIKYEEDLRLFGGEERQVAWREASVSSLSHVLFTFIGKDISSLVEITLAAVVFTLAHWPLAHSFASGTDLFEVGFGIIYCIWGLNHFLAIVCPPSVGMLVAVILSFLSFLFAGIKPEAKVIASSLGGYGIFLLLASPVRWAMSQWLFLHVTGLGSTYMEPAFVDQADAIFTKRGYSLHAATCPNHTQGVAERWANQSGWVCHSGHLLLLGILFRFIAVIALLFTSSAKASGGQLSLGATSIAKSRMLRDCLAIFLTFVTLLNILLLGKMY